MKRLVPFVAAAIAAAGLTVSATQQDRISSQSGQDGTTPPAFDVVEATIADMQAALTEGRLTSRQLVRLYLDRIREVEPTLNPYITLNPRVMQEARQLDAERAAGRVRGPLHGIPIALKDNIQTVGITTTGGALAFDGFKPPYNATLVRNLKRAGAIILGKTVLTELANWVAEGMPGNYSAVGGFGFNPYDPRIDPRTDPPFNDGRPVLATGGSSSGIATAANLAAANVGTETSGSILSPSNQNMLVGIKPTVGLISRWGVIPITADQDTAGPMARTVADAATMLGAMTGFDRFDAATATCPVVKDYSPHLKADGLQGARIGIPRQLYYTGAPPEQVAVAEEAIAILKAAGATIVDPADIPSVVSGELPAWGICAGLAQGKGGDTACSVVLKYGMKRDFNLYLRTLGRKAPIASLGALIAFNTANAANNAIKYGQARLLISEEMSVTADAARYFADRAKDLDLTKTKGIDAAIDANQLDALLFPGARGADIAARPGYPSVIVPAGFVPNLPPSTQPPFPGDFQPNPAPFGVTFTGKACSEGRLIELAYAYEQASLERVPPSSAP